MVLFYLYGYSNGFVLKVSRLQKKNIYISITKNKQKGEMSWTKAEAV